MRRMICVFIILCLLFSLLPTVSAVETMSTTLTDDVTFFNAFDLALMPAVEEAVSAGAYDVAKEALLNFYTEKFAKLSPSYATGTKGAMLYLAPRNTFAFSEAYLCNVDIGSNSYKEYILNLGTNKTGAYVLSMIDKTEGEILISSRESATLCPKLIVTCADGTTKTLDAIADSYVRAGSFASQNYGIEQTLYIHDDATGTMPYGENSKRAYIKFDTFEIPTDATNIKLSVYAKCSGSDETLRLNVFSAYFTDWTESSLTWKLIADNNGFGHFSWSGIPGGFTWTEPEGVASQWLVYNMRFYEVTSLVQAALKAGEGSENYKSYMTYAKNLLLDFINDAGAGMPTGNSGLEPANRLLEFPYIYKHLLAGGFLTADENVEILSWVHDEGAHLNAGTTLFNADNTVKSDQAYTNHGFWHLAGFYQSFAFFPEFCDASAWRKNYNARQSIVVDALIDDEGSYNEITFGYPAEVINWSSTLLTAMNVTNDTSSAAKDFNTKLVNLAKYIVDSTLPSGKAPFWGQGGPAASKTSVAKVLTAIGDSMDSVQKVQELRYFLNHTEGSRPDVTAKYEHVKLVTDRTGWDSTDSMIFMNAKCAGNHSHRDALALILYSGGRSLLTDTGMTSYDRAHVHYDWQNSTSRSHNTIEIDGKAQVLYQNLSDAHLLGDIDIASNDYVATVTAWSKANNDDTSTKSLSLDGTINNKVYHSTDFTHYRDVSFIKALGDIVVVTDKVVPDDTSSHSYTQNWHSEPYSNPTIDDSDAYKTGRTNFATGANLIIAQAYNTNNASLNAVISPTLRSGYDTSAPAATTQYFEYKQTGSGTITYQTVLYPVSEGATATIKPLKLSMANTNDATALASRIAIEDSAKPDIKVLYHYHSFEETPVLRTFGGHSTDASTAMVALNKVANGSAVFASIANGSTLYTADRKILELSQIVSDIAVFYDGATLHIESSDASIKQTSITVNLSGQAVSTVLLNGTAVPFEQEEDGTLNIGGKYIFTNFYESALFADAACWSTKNVTLTADHLNGLLHGEITGGDPYINLNNPLSYPIKEGDVIELRIKNTITSGSYSGLQFFYMTKEDPDISEGKSLRDNQADYSDEFITIQFVLPAMLAGQTLTDFRIDPISSLNNSGTQGSFDIDYLYIGSPEYAPSSYNNTIFFDYTNDEVSQLRYAAETYGDRNYDTAFWRGNSNNIKNICYEDGHLSFELTDNATSAYIQSTDSSNTLVATPLSYVPSEDDVIQIRFKLEDIEILSDSAPSLRLYYIKNNVTSGIISSDYTFLARLTDAHVGEYTTLTVPLKESFTTADVINAIRPQFVGLRSASGKVGKIYIDYISIAPPVQVEPETFTVSFSNEDGSLLQTLTLYKGETAIYTADTPVKPYDSEKHFTFVGWDKDLSNITADTTATAQFSAQAHAWNDGEVVLRPTCVTEGTMRFVCTGCECEKTEVLALMPHNDSYADNDDGSHNVICTVCARMLTQEHDFTDGVCICGAEDTAEPEYVLDTNLAFMMNISAGAEMQVRYTIMKGTVATFESFYLVVTKAVADAQSIITTYELADLTPVYNPISGELTAYQAVYTGINAKEMGDDFSAVLYALASNGTIHYSRTNTSSMKSYLIGKIDSESSIPEMKTMCVDMLHYGAAAQIRLNYNVENLVDADLTEEQLSYGTNTLAEAIDHTASVGDGIKLFSSVSVQSKVLLYVNGKYEPTDNADMKYVVADAKSGEVLQTITATQNTNFWQGVYANVGAKQMRQLLKITLYDGETAVSQTLTWSIESYVASVRAKASATEAEINMVNAMLVYGDCVAAYMSASGQ